MVVLCNTKYQGLEKESYFQSYPYPLSDFQKWAIDAIVEGHHVLVTAHTGSGKTLPAEFAINHFVKRPCKKRVIYTSPIKALSNQKYYEFSQKYPEISFGLFTGDIKTNPEADVLIMTTEILMNALMNASFSDKKEISSISSLDFTMDLNTELAAVVFDEVHYINDPDRGQTWEKTLIMLPSHIQRIMLSATIDAPERFAEWCETVSNSGSSSEDSKKQVYLASTNHRVVPLTHYGVLTVSESLLKSIKDKAIQQDIRKNTNSLIPLQTAKGVYQEDGYKTITRISKILENHPFQKRKFVLNQLGGFLKENDMLPAIAFVFSRKHVEICATEITIPLLEDDSKIPYIVNRECDQIIRKLHNYEEYMHLPEYVSLVKLLEKGIGIHHSGMIPVLREIVELLISKKYIKLLFATESFAIGLDCPIKTAIFTGITKFDGNNERYLLSHEYTQMAGRAGRRGIDTVGHVVHCNNLFSLPTQTEYKNMMCGKPQELVSKFRVSYNLVLQLSGCPEEDSIEKEDPLEFVNKSMIYGELQGNIQAQKRKIEELEKSLERKKENLKWMKMPVETCIRFIEIEKELPRSINKKKKELQKEEREIRDNYKTCENDAKTYKEIYNVEKEIEKELRQLEFTENYLDRQIKAITQLLEGRGFLQSNSTENNMAIIAKSLSEVHPTIWGECIVNKWNYFAEFSEKQLVGLFSCITDVKVSQEYRIHHPPSEDGFLKKTLEELNDMHLLYEKLETDHGIQNTGFHYEDAIKYNIVNESMEWCDCKTEEECKWFIQTKLATKEISVGDFTKAMMKITTFAKELMSLEKLLIGKTEMFYKLAQIDGLVLKYVATAQSLYV